VEIWDKVLFILEGIKEETLVFPAIMKYNFVVI